ncbi:MAG: glutamate racemase [Psittacicella sp.]
MKNILVLDSGIGGFSILKTLLNNIDANFLYYMDNLYIPYSTKDPEFIVTRVRKIITYFLKNYKINAVIIACNTATLSSYSILKSEFNIPLIGTTPPIEEAFLKSRSQNVALLCTEATKKFLLSKQGCYKSLEIISSTELVALAENKFINNLDVTEKVFLELHSKILRKVDTIICGCTHFPFLIPEIKNVINIEREALDSSINFIEPSFIVCNKVIETLHLTKKNILKSRFNSKVFYNGNYSFDNLGVISIEYGINLIKKVIIE